MGLRAAAQIEVPRITIHELKSMIDQRATVLILDTQFRENWRRGETASIGAITDMTGATRNAQSLARSESVPNLAVHRTARAVPFYDFVRKSTGLTIYESLWKPWLPLTAVVGQGMSDDMTINTEGEGI